MNDLHVSIATRFHQSFPWLYPLTIFRILTNILLLEPFTNDQGRLMLHLAIRILNLLSLHIRVFEHAYSHTRIHFRLLNLCFKTGQLKPFRQNLHKIKQHLNFNIIIQKLNLPEIYLCLTLS